MGCRLMAPIDGKTWQAWQDHRITFKAWRGNSLEDALALATFSQKLPILNEVRQIKECLDVLLVSWSVCMCVYLLLLTTVFPTRTGKLPLNID